MDDCKGVCYELAMQDSKERLAHDIGRSFLGLLGWAQAALVLACFALAFGAWTPRAYAAQSTPEMVIDGNFVGDDVGSKGYMCAYCSPYTATLELIGHYSDIVQIDQEKYSWLVGGDNPFSAAMNRWEELTGASNEDMENSWLGDDGFIDGWLILAGKGNCWYGTFTDQQIHNAEIAFNSIMQGGTGGGDDSPGGELGDEDGLKTVTLTARLNPHENKTITITEINSLGIGNNGIGTVSWGSNVGTLTWNEGHELKMYIDPYSLSKIRSDIERLGGDPDTWHFVYCRGWGTTFVVVSEQPIEFQRANGDTGTYFFVKNANEEPVRVMSYDSYRTGVGRYNGKVCCLLFKVTQRYSVTVASGETYSAQARPYWNSEGDISQPEVPDVPMPDTPDDTGPSPTAPEPPDLPDFGDPTVPHEPDPTPPTTEPTPPTLPTPITVTVPTDTSPNDYTPWLRAILEELKNINAALNSYLQSIIDEMAEHCQHIRDEMGTQAAYLGECLDSVASAAAGVGDQLENALHDYAEWLAEYFDQWGEWLVAHLDFNNEVTVDPYDDTSLLYWLKRIYAKLGGSNNPVNTRPTDPVTNPVETGNWLEELWNEILKNLAQLFPNLMIDLGLIFDDLKSKFPFSIPWDIHALMLLLVTEPVAPHFTVPMYAISTSYELEVVGEYDIDLSVYTDYLAGVHLMLEISWIGYMLKHTRDYMELIEAVIPS